MSALMTSFNAKLARNNDLSVLGELSEMLKDIISNIATIIKRNQNDLQETQGHLQESLNQIKIPETIKEPIFEKKQAFNVTRGYKIGEIKSYHHNYEFSMEIKHASSSSVGRILQGLLKNVYFYYQANIVSADKL